MFFKNQGQNAFW